MKIEAPTNCPSCDSSLVWKKDLLFCMNVSCKGQATQRVENFAKVLKIKGLGPKAIERLGLTGILQIYDLTEDYIAFALGSERLAAKLYAEIQASRSATLQDLLPAFSIPLIGKTAAEKVCGAISHISDLSTAVCIEAGLGPKATENLMDWYYEEYLDGFHFLPFSFKTQAKAVSSEARGVVCITGRLNSVKTKAEAEKLLVGAGYSVKTSITKDVTILLNESGMESAKTKKARDNGVSISNNLFDII